MTVKELCNKYKISHQAVYAKIRKKKDLLDGHITKSGGQLVLDEYAEELLKPKCADFTLVRKIQNLQNQLDNKNAECENLKNSLCEKTSENENLQIQLDDKNSEIEKLQSQLAEQNLKNANFENLADMLKSEILNISSKIDNIQISISEAAKKPSGGLAGLLKSN